MDRFLWEEKFQAAQRYFQEFGDLEVPKLYEAPDGTRLGNWIQSVRQDYKAGRLEEEQVKRLEALGMVWDVEQARWERQYRAAREYLRTHGNLDIPSRYETPDGLKLGQWLQRMRRDYKSGVLEEERARRLEAIGITWDMADRQWEEYYRAAQRYYQEHGDLRLSPRYATPDGTRLGTWIQRLRKGYKQGKLTGEQIQRLEEIGMVWDGAGEQRERNYRAALAYYREYGHLRIPADYVSADGIHLGWWVKGVRRAYKNGTLDEEQIHRLERIGMVWSATSQREFAVQKGAEQTQDGPRAG